MVSRPASRMSTQSSRSRTAPPTTDFDTDDESDSKKKAKDLRQSKKRAGKRALTQKRSAPKVCSLWPFSWLVLMSNLKLKPGRRAQAFEAEVFVLKGFPDIVIHLVPFTQQPSIKMSAATGWSEGKVTPTPIADDQWPPGAQLILPASGKPSDLGLWDQYPIIQSIVRKAIQKVTDEMVLNEAWPEAKERPLYEKKILLDACHEIIENCGDSDRHVVKAVKNRVKTDAAFAKALANVVCTISLLNALWAI